MNRNMKRICLFCGHRWTAKKKHSGIQCPKCKRYQTTVPQETVIRISEEKFKRLCKELDCKMRLNKSSSRIAGFPKFTVRDKKSDRKCRIYIKLPGKGLQVRELIATERLHRKGERVVILYIVDKEIYFFKLFRIDSVKRNVKQEKEG